MSVEMSHSGTSLDHRSVRGPMVRSACPAWRNREHTTVLVSHVSYCLCVTSCSFVGQSVRPPAAYRLASSSSGSRCRVQSRVSNWSTRAWNEWMLPHTRLLEDCGPASEQSTGGLNLLDRTIRSIACRAEAVAQAVATIAWRDGASAAMYRSRCHPAAVVMTDHLRPPRHQQTAPSHRRRYEYASTTNRQSTAAHHCASCLMRR
jgi:hypothetical protein